MKVKNSFSITHILWEERERNGETIHLGDICRYRISISRFVCRIESFSEIPPSDKGAPFAICRFYVYVKTVTFTTYIYSTLNGNVTFGESLITFGKIEISRASGESNFCACTNLQISLRRNTHIIMHNSLDPVDRSLLRRKCVIPAIAQIPGKATYDE